MDENKTLSDQLDESPKQEIFQNSENSIQSDDNVLNDTSEKKVYASC